MATFELSLPLQDFNHLVQLGPHGSLVDICGTQSKQQQGYEIVCWYQSEEDFALAATSIKLRGRHVFWSHQPGLRAATRVSSAP